MGKQSRSKMNQVVDIIQDKIKSNMDILKLLHYDDDKVSVYEQPDLNIQQVLDVVKSKVLTHKKEFSDSEACCYMILRYGAKEYHGRRNRWFSGNSFDIWVLCHNSIVENEKCGNRVSEIEGIIMELFDNKNLEGVTCKCDINRSESVDVRSSDYSGRYIEIIFSDFDE